VIPVLYAIDAARSTNS